MVASYPQVMQQLLQGNSEKARYSQVTVIHSHGLKHCRAAPRAHADCWDRGPRVLDAGALGSESAGGLAPSRVGWRHHALGRGPGDAGAGPICPASSWTLIRVTAKTAGHEAARLPSGFRRASLDGATALPTGLVRRRWRQPSYGFGKEAGCAPPWRSATVELEERVHVLIALRLNAARPGRAGSESAVIRAVTQSDWARAHHGMDSEAPARTRRAGAHHGGRGHSIACHGRRSGCRRNLNGNPPALPPDRGAGPARPTGSTAAGPSPGPGGDLEPSRLPAQPAAWRRQHRLGGAGRARRTQD